MSLSLRGGGGQCLASLLRRSFSSSSQLPRIGLIGCGKMGNAMSGNLVAAGYEVFAFDLDRASLDAVVEKGAQACDSVAELASQADTVISILPNDAVLRSVVGDDSQGLLADMKDGAVHISCSTISPHTAREIGAAHEAAGKTYVSAPVFARPDGMANKQGNFVISGPADAAKHADTILSQTAAKNFVFGEDAGAANVVKLCGNFMIASAIETIGETAALAENNGVDREEVIDMLRSTIFDCLIYNGYGQRVAQRDHAPKPTNFALELGMKDVNLVKDTAYRSATPMPFASVLHDRFVSAKAQGRGDLDWSSIGLNISEDAGVKDIQIK